MLTSFGLYQAMLFGQESNRVAEFLPTAHFEIDSTRKEVKRTPTTLENFSYRLNILDSWARLMAFAGADLGALEGYFYLNKQAKKISEKEYYQAIDKTFFGMERMYANFMTTPEGKEFNPRAQFERNTKEWPLFHGSEKQTRTTEDPGPVKGDLAWKFPTGRPWYSRPAVEDGKVYVSSPGMTTILYRLNEKDGKVEWKARQRGSGHQYGTARMNSSVLLLKDAAIVREVGSGGEKGHQKHFVYVNKKTGKVIKEEYAGHIDYRVGNAPLAGNDDFLFYPHGVQSIHWAKERTITTFDSLMCKNPKTGELLWKQYIGEYWTEPLLQNNKVYVGSVSGTVSAFDARKGGQGALWKFQVDASVNAKLAANEKIVIAAAENGKVYGLDPNSGAKLWEYNVDYIETKAFQQFSQAEISGDKVFIGGANKNLYCLDITSGNLLWKRNLDDWVRAKPLFNKGKIYVATLSGKLYKLTEKGDVVWIRQPTGHQVFADLVMGEYSLLLNSSDLYLHSIDIETGKENWRHSLMEAVYSHNDRIWADFDGGGGDFQASPMVAEGMVIAAGPDRFVHALDHHTGKEIWRFEVRGQIPAAPIFYGGKIYFGQQGGTGYYYCINAFTGELEWKKELGWGWASANASEGKIYVPTVSGWIYCLNAETGDVIWEYNTENGTYPAPAIEENVVVFGSWNDKYYGFDKETGKKLWEKSIGGNPDSGAALTYDGKAYLQGLASDYFFCVDVKTGKELWKFPLPDGYECNMSPSINNDKLFFSIFKNGQVCQQAIPSITYALNAQTGEKIWELSGGGGLTGTANANGNVFFGSSVDPYIWSVSEDGNGDGSTKVNWKFKMNGRAEESCITIAYGKAYILATDGYIYAIE